ncbi:MAG: hypothetical protein P4L69_07140 [Desulfosporosinus sp.]|nr:hypothetical protein [Desulfosporosinus sp.]
MSVQKNDIPWCNIAIAWGADCDKVLWRAAAEGQVEICRVAARDWQVSVAGWDEALRAAARGGHEAICHIAKENGALNLDGMLVSAARGGHTEICCLAKTWGAVAFRNMMEAAAQNGHRGLAKLGFEWVVQKYEV